MDHFYDHGVMIIKRKQQQPDSIETLLLHADRGLDSASSLAPPIYQTATFRGSSDEDFAQRSGSVRHPEFYTRYGNPTHQRVESLVAELEGAESALVTASGMGAITATVLSLVEKGAHVIAQHNHYGGTHDLMRDFLPKFGVEVTRVDQRDIANFQRAIRPNTKLIFLETPSNPVWRLTDLRAVAKLAKQHGAITVVDNSIATPINQRPLELGIDLAVHSATKFMGGHSDLSAGVVAGPRVLIDKIWKHHVMIGAVLGPIDAWLLLRGLRTLPLRMKQHNANAQALAELLAQHPAVKQVHYPGLKNSPQYAIAARQMHGFGPALSFELRGGTSASSKFLAGLRLPSRAAGLGGVETQVVDAAANFLLYMNSKEAAEIGIAPGLIRVSAGLENTADLLADFEQALQRIPRSAARLKSAVATG